MALPVTNRLIKQFSGHTIASKSLFWQFSLRRQLCGSMVATSLVIWARSFRLDPDRPPKDRKHKARYFPGQQIRFKPLCPPPIGTTHCLQWVFTAIVSGVFELSNLKLFYLNSNRCGFCSKTSLVSLLVPFFSKLHHILWRGCQASHP